MSLFRSLVSNLKQQATGHRTWTPAEVRELIERKALDEAEIALDHLIPDLSKRSAVRACLMGEVLFQRRDDEGALNAFREALREVPGMPSAHYGLSLLYAESGSLQDALRHAFFADSVEPNDARLLAQVGYCQLQLKNFALAEGPLRRASLLAPRNAQVLNNLGVVLLNKGKLQEAHDCLRRAVQLDPDFKSAADNLARLMADLRDALGYEPGDPAADPASGPTSMTPTRDEGLEEVRALEHSGNLQAAIRRCEQLVMAQPDVAEPALEAHRLYVRAGDPASGIDVLEAYRSRNRNDLDVAAALGLARLDLREFARAEGLLRQAVSAASVSADHLLGLADALSGMERYAEAGQWIEKAACIEPDSLAVKMAGAANLVNQCRYVEALAACRALEAKGMNVPSIGVVLGYLGRIDEAEAALAESIRSRPNDPHVRYHLAGLRLLQLDFERGWDHYQYRGFGSGENFRVLPFKLWKGEPIAGLRVLVLAEQGLGDQVMFASCLPDLLALGPADVVVEAVDRIAPTLQRSFPEVRVVATKQGRKLDWLREYSETDYYIPLADLPRYFRRSLKSFPDRPSYLVPDAGRVTYWRARLEATGPGPYIGFSWKGGVESTRMPLRTIEPNAFAPLFEVVPETWVCLQYGPIESQVNEARSAGLPLIYWPEAISDLDEFAALVSALDLVITVCNTTVHYAGALGKKVWILAPMVPEWRYGLCNKTMPWYPNSVIFRQESLGDWTSVFDQVRENLKSFAVEAQLALAPTIDPRPN